MRSTRKGIVISCSLPTAYMHSREAGCGWFFVLGRSPLHQFGGQISRRSQIGNNPNLDGRPDANTGAICSPLSHYLRAQNLPDSNLRDS